jgi:hypothetical protein
MLNSYARPAFLGTCISLRSADLIPQRHGLSDQPCRREPTGEIAIDPPRTFAGTSPTSAAVATYCSSSWLTSSSVAIGKRGESPYVRIFG